MPKLSQHYDVPAGLDYDRWVGHVELRPYTPFWVPWNWRGWLPFGTGTIGDWICNVVDPITRWRIADPFTFYIAVRDESGARARLDDIVLSAMREEMATHNFADIIDKQREVIEVNVSKAAAERAKAFGLEIIDTRIKRADLPIEVQNSVFARMVAERGQVSKRYRSEGEEESIKVRADADKDAIHETAQVMDQSARSFVAYPL